MQPADEIRNSRTTDLNNNFFVIRGSISFIFKLSINDFRHKDWLKEADQEFYAFKNPDDNLLYGELKLISARFAETNTITLKNQLWSLKAMNKIESRSYLNLVPAGICMLKAMVKSKEISENPVSELFPFVYSILELFFV